jgi:hypothetical protein
MAKADTFESILGGGRMREAVRKLAMKHPS